MLVHRPWVCGNPTEEPPINADTAVLDYFRTMVIFFFSHAQWRNAQWFYQETVPKAYKWLSDYWECYLKHKTKHDLGPAFGPLHIYLKYEDAARSCLNQSAGLKPPNHEVKQWQPWEIMLQEKRELVFWNPHLLKNVMIDH